MEKPTSCVSTRTPGGIAFGYHPALVDHDDRFGPPKRRLRGLFEGMIERGF
jgi:hypothetical protein